MSFQTISDVYSKAIPISKITTSKTTTTTKPLVKPIVPGCLPVFDAYPLPKVPPEVQRLKVEMNAVIENLYKSNEFKVCFLQFAMILWK